MLTTVCTTLFFMTLAYFAWLKGRKILMFVLIILAIVSFYLLFKADQKLLALADAPISERRAAILEYSMLMQSGSDSNSTKEFYSTIERLTKDDGVFSNKDYDKIKKYLSPMVISQVNSKFPNAEQEENALNEITGGEAK